MEENPETEEDVLEPQEETRPRTTGLFCFIESTRVCGPACMSYVTFPKQGAAGELSDQQIHCILLSSAERVGRNVTALASMQAQAAKRQRIDAADKSRLQQLEQDPIKASQRSPFPGAKP